MSLVRSLLLAGMESCWLAALAGAFDAAFAATAYPAGWMVAALARKLGAGWKLRAIACTACMVAGLYVLARWMPSPGHAASLQELMLSPEYKRLGVAALVLAAAWLRGWTLAGRSIERGEVASSFQVGLFVLMGALAFAGSAAQVVLSQLAVAYVAIALLALWHARSGTGSPKLGLPVFIAAAGVVGVVIALGFAATALIAPSTIAALLEAPAWLLGRVVASMRSLVESIPQAPGPQDAPSAPAEALPSVNEPAWVRPLFAFLRAHSSVLGMIVYVLIGAALVYALYRWRLRRAAQITRTAGLVYRRSSATLWGACLALLRALRLRARTVASRLRSAAHALSARRRRDSSVRSLYHDVLRTLAARGWRRAAYESPEEYQRRVLAAWPGAAPALESLTAAFVADRYGPVPVEPGGVVASARELRRNAGKAGRGNG